MLQVWSYSFNDCPTAGQQLHWRSIQKLFLLWHDGNIWNLNRATHIANMEDSFSLMQIDHEARLLGCLIKLYHLTSQALVLCHNHLQWRLLLAQEGSGNETGHKIMWIAKNEDQKWQQCRIYNAVKNARGWSVLRESVHIEAGEHCCMHGAMLKTLVPWWMLLTGQMSTYECLPTSKGFGALYWHLSSRKPWYHLWVPPRLQPDYSWLFVPYHYALFRIWWYPNNWIWYHNEYCLYFWSTCKVRNVSSKSGQHFGHYSASCNDLYLVSLYVWNINEWAAFLVETRCYHPIGKVARSNYFDRLWAIFLHVADLNWWLKITFLSKWCLGGARDPSHLFRKLSRL